MDTTTGSTLYRRIWRWHFFAGLFCVPFILSLALTGGAYLFHAQIDDIVYAKEMLRAEGAAPGERLPASHLIDQAVRAFPGRAAALTLPADGLHTAQVDVQRPGAGTLQVFVDPVAGSVTGSVAEADRMMTLVKRIHSLSVLGDAGNVLIEIVAGWIIVLVATGIYLWWPRGRSGGVVSIRPAAKGRTWWRDLHAVTGIFAGVVVLFLALTGMPWSIVWGTNVNAWLSARDLGVPHGVWAGIPRSTLPAAALGELPWSQQAQPVPASDPHAAHHGAAAHPDVGHGPAPAHAQGPDSVVRTLAAIGLHDGYRLVLPRDAHGVYSAIRMPGKLEERRVVHVDQYSGAVLMDIGAAQIRPVGRITEWGVAVHQGEQYGAINLAVMLAGCLALVAMCISGIAAWWLRRPAGRLAAPPRRESDRLARGVLAIAAVLGCIFPLLGASMLAVLLLDWLLQSLRGNPQQTTTN
ncbi:PepSY-associated TM helix domain-containing protein [Pseudoduganella lutea]|uniref:PepSY domain-containing protein n=1 Tax=Pseudoduganella lutea TaxID=321985 RepID=A0A4P6L360_9BURK|nr:PepSY domain-containing protein [Pseudoduganella lutea]QBE65901.1 PepSY domain-containing protein [Pseudoduganella lutea]